MGMIYEFSQMSYLLLKNCNLANIKKLISYDRRNYNV